MATADQLKSLIRTHFNDQTEHFYTTALQIAAHEAKKGHSSLAIEIRALVDKAKAQPGRVLQFTPDLSKLVLVTQSPMLLSSLVVPEAMIERIKRILREYKLKSKLERHGLTHRRKILLAGAPGTGKTMTASVLAGELHLPLYTIMMDKLVTKFMGETSAKLRQIFDFIETERGVFLFDEFDAIGGERSLDNDVGEMRRVLNSFLQFIERDTSDSLIVAATNNPKILDQALFRRFDDVLHYQKPDPDEIVRLVENRLATYRPKSIPKKTLIENADSLSHAEITQACDDAIKESILSDKSKVPMKLLVQMLKERQSAYTQAL